VAGSFLNCGMIRSCSPIRRARCRFIGDQLL
jgi:hypothetical protein